MSGSFQCLTFLALDIRKKFYSLRIDYEIEDVYYFKMDISLPLILLSDPDLKRILYIRNFWQRHLINEKEDTFFDAYSTLPANQRPKPWDRPLEEQLKWRASWYGFQCMWLPDYCQFSR